MNAPSTINPDEVRYYERLAEQWWDESGKFWPLHRLNRLRRDYLVKLICRHFGRDPKAARPLADLDIVDIGCGGGLLSEAMAELGARVTGIDVVEKGLRVARQHASGRELDIHYRHMTVEELAASGRRFDVVLNMEVVEHVEALPTFIEQCSRLLQPDGITFVATINRNPLSWLFAIVGAEYILRWLPRGTHRWSKFVTPGELRELMGRSGLAFDAAAGVRINPFTRRFSLSRSLRVNYMVAASFRRAADAG